MRLVVDTGPLIALSKTGHLDLLPRLFEEVIIPAAVLGEIARPGETRPGSEVQNRTWVVRRGVSTSARVQLQKSSDIAAGEAEAILIGAEAPGSTVLLMDERRARRVAAERGLHTLRTGAFLVAAVRRGLLQPDDVRHALEVLQRERYLDSRAVDDILAVMRRA
jgi:predicted nucleic acid-binding protein